MRGQGKRRGGGGGGVFHLELSVARIVSWQFDCTQDVPDVMLQKTHGETGRRSHMNKPPFSAKSTRTTRHVSRARDMTAAPSCPRSHAMANTTLHTKAKTPIVAAYPAATGEDLRAMTSS
jgi:hypothetical protein